jgi:hypothetical protein
MALLAKSSPKFRTLGTHRSVAPLLPPSTPSGTASQAPSRLLQLPPPTPSPLIVWTLAAIRLTNSGGPLTGATARGSPLNGSPTTCGLRQFSKSSKAQGPRAARPVHAPNEVVLSISVSSNRYRSSQTFALQSMRGQPPLSTMHKPL